MVEESPESWLHVVVGEAPLVVSIPHAGMHLPVKVLSTLHSAALARRDTDWYLERIYDVAGAVGATLIRTTISRTVVDMNRDPAGSELYPGMASTGLCPLTTFDGDTLYRPGREPDAAEITARQERYFYPYHETLQRHVSRLREHHKQVVVFDAHSIRSRVPRLFEGLLPAFNLGTNSDASCAPELIRRLERIIDGTGESWVTNGRFKGGYITRTYGQPANGVHAVQLETALRAYTNEPVEPDFKRAWPPAFAEQGAATMRRLVGRLLSECIGFCRSAA